MTDSNHIQQRMLDQLVDNELTELDRRRLLQALDNTTDGWRRCAVAFLESQAYHSSLDCHRQADLEEPSSKSTPAVRIGQRGTKSIAKKTMTGLAIAASMAVAFVAGGRQSRTDDLPKPPAPAIANSRADTTSDHATLLDVPPDIRRMLEAAGTEVVQRDRRVPVWLHDGSSVQIPVQEVEFRPVKFQTY